MITQRRNYRNVEWNAEAFVPHDAKPEDAAAYLAWAKRCAKESDHPRCAYHRHRSGEPCGADCCEVLSDGTLKPLVAAR